MKKLLFAVFVLVLCGFGARPLAAQDWYEGLWQGYDGEWRHVSRQLIALAEATPEEKFAWRPAPGVRVNGRDATVDLALEVFWRFREVRLLYGIERTFQPVGGMHMRIIVHANEHMGQLVAYARMTGVVPPWSGK